MKTLALFLVSFLISVCGIAPGQNTVSAQEDNSLQEIQDAGVLRVGTSGDYPPFEFYTEVDGERQLVGMDISIAQDIAQDLGVELEMNDLGSFDSLIPALESGQIDMILAGMTPTEERQQNVDFSQTYYEEGQRFLIPEEDSDTFTSIESLEGEDGQDEEEYNTIGVQQGSLQEVLVQDMENVNTSVMPDISSLILGLQSGQIDAVLLGGVTAEMYEASYDGLTSFEVEFESDQSLGIGAAFRPGSDSLVNAVNESLTAMEEDGRIQQHFEQAVDTVTQDGLSGSEQEESQSFLAEYGSYFWDGTKITLFISAVSVLVGMILGSILALMRISPSKLLKFLGAAYVEFIRGTPLMIQVMIIYFGSGVVYPLSALTAGIVATSLNSGAYICEIIRSGLGSVDPGQTEAARSLGMSKKQSMRHIIFPQAIKNIWPSLGNEFITVIKESSIVSVIGVSELIFQSRVVRSISFRGIVPLLITALIYFILTFTLTKILNYFEGRMNYD